MIKKSIVKTLVKKEKKALPVRPAGAPHGPLEEKPGRYFAAKGGRKTAVARVRLLTKGLGININGKDYQEYFKQLFFQKKVASPLEVMNVLDKVGVVVKVYGGGLTGQAEAVRHGIARALSLFNPDFRKRLRRYGFLTRDPRMVERKKYGLKKARRAPQWAKR